MDELANNSPETAELATADLEQGTADTEQPDSDHADGSDHDLDTQGVDPEFEEVDVEGEKLAVPKSAAEKLRAAMLRQADYTRKTQELADLRKQSESEIAQGKARVEAERAQIQSVARVVALDERLQQYANTDWHALSQTDPVRAQQDFFTFQTLKDQRAGLVQQIQQHEAQRALQEQEATARALQQANEVLGREIKGWSPEVAKELRSVAKSLGADDKDLDAIRAPWVVRALYAQKVLSEMTAKAAKAPAPAPAVPVKTVTGSSAKPAFDPDKASIDEYMRHERKRLARSGRL